MPEETQVTTTYSRQAGKNVPSYRGASAGRSFATSAETSEESDWQEYKLEKKLSFAASKKQHEADFRDWRKKKAAKKGQAQALK